MKFAEMSTMATFILRPQLYREVVGCCISLQRGTNRYARRPCTMISGRRPLMVQSLRAVPGPGCDHDIEGALGTMRTAWPTRATLTVPGPGPV